MIGIVIAAHGDLADGLLSAARLILGEVSGTVAIGLRAGESPDDLAGRLARALSDAEDGNGVVVLTDLRGGSPFNQASLIARGDGHRVLTGANLPMLLQVLTEREDRDLDELAGGASAAGIEGIAATEEKKASGSRGIF